MDVDVPPFLVVEVDERRFGVETARIRTVVEYRTPTPIPGRPAPFLGALNHHGELLPLVPLATLLGVRHRFDPVRCAVVVLGWEDAILGLLVEQTHGLITSVERARAAHVLGRWDGPHLAGSFDAEGQMIHLLDVDSLLADVDRRL